MPHPSEEPRPAPGPRGPSPGARRRFGSPPRLGALVLLLLGASLGACLPMGMEEGPPSAEERQQQDIDDYRALSRELEKRRTEFLPRGPTELHGGRGSLFWLDFSRFDPTLHGFDEATQRHIQYGFSIGSGQHYNYRASGKLIATAQRVGGKLFFRAYRTTATHEQVGELQVPAPRDEQQWWAYDVDGETLYYVTTGGAAGTELLQWTPGSAAPIRVLVLEDTGVDVGVFEDFSIEGEWMLLVESGRLWRLNLSTRTAKWMRATKELNGPVQFDDSGVLYNTAGGALYYDAATDAFRDISAEIKASSYRLSETFAQGHLLVEGATRRGQTVYYIGSSGLFSYELGSRAVKPVLLNPHSATPRIDYRYPQVVSNDSLYVLGLTSTSGAVGADGPVYRVSLAP